MTGPQRIRRAFTLRAHLFAFAGAILLPVSVLTAALLFNSAELQREQLETQLGQVAGDLTDDIDRFVSNLMTTLQTLATSPALHEGDLEVFSRQASAAARTMGANAISLVDPTTMAQVVNTLLPWGAEMPMTGDPPSVQKVADSHGAVVSNYFIGRVSRAPAWNVAIPVFDGERVLYVLLAGMTGLMAPLVVAHGEGRVDETEAAARACVRYVDSHGEPAARYPENPNGSPGGATGFTSDDGRATILMPHPERVFLRSQYSWLPTPPATGEGPWFGLFANARRFVG